jgi:hypothetical protein
MKKKLFLAFSVLVSASAAVAQQRLILAESFSQASCGPCAAANPAFEALLNANSSKIIAIKYQVSWPGVDPMNAQNPTEIASRSNFYNVSGVPDRAMDGTMTDPNQSNIDARYAVPSPVNMTLSHVINPGFTTANVALTITAPSIWAPSNTVVHLAMVETVINFATAPGSNGETEFHNVMRKMYPGSTGTAVVASNFATAGGSQTFTFTNLAIPSYIYKLEKVAFIAWVQNTSTKEIYQAGMSQPVALTDYAVLNSLTVPAEYSCAANVENAVAVIANGGGTVINSATVNYKIDNGSVAQTPLTGGPIAVGNSINFTIPSTPVSSGSHTLTTFLTNINGSGLTNPIGSKTANFATMNGAASTSPISQNFTVSAFPYANYYVNSTSNNNWTRATANTGCIKYDNFNYASGSKGNVHLAPVNMTSLTSSTMTFDVAYRSYSTQSDKLEVFVSTNCGSTWTSVYTKSGSTLSTGAAQTTAFTPTASEWRTETVNLASYASATNLIIKFVATSAYGNNLYVDNINLAGSLAVTELDEKEFTIFPNPASDVINVAFEAKNTNYQVLVSDLSGRQVVSTNYSNLAGAQSIAVPVSELVSGSYFVTILSEGVSYTKQVVIK